MRFVSYYSRAISDRSGVTESLWSWAAALTDAGHEVRILHAGGERRSPEPAHQRPTLRDEALPHRGHGRATYRPQGVDRFLDPGEVLILHEGWVLSNVLVARAATRVGAPYLVVPHGVYEPAIRETLKPPRWLRTRIERSVVEGAAAVQVFFESEIALARDVGPRLRGAIVAPNGITVPDDRWSGGGGYLAWIGRYDPLHKGLDVLLRAMARLAPSERPRLELRGPDYHGGEAVVRGLIDTLGLADHVIAGGPIYGADKAAFLRAADGYVMPSRWDSHPIALTENLALGAPCLASSGMHIAALLEADEAAVVADPTEEGLADGLRRFAVADRIRLGQRAREFATARFSWEVVVPAFVAGVERAISDRPDR